MINIIGSTLPIEIYSQSERNAISSTWFDGPLSFFEKLDADYISFAADGNKGTVKAIGPKSNFASSSTTVSLLSGLPIGIEYVGGGPTLRVDEDTIAMVQHFERWPAGGSLNFWSSFGVAKSLDEGESWECLGEMLTMSYDYNPAATQYQQDMQGGPIVPIGLYYYIYFREYIGPINWDDSYWSVARCLITDFNTAILSDITPTWEKWQGGNSWGETNTGYPLNIPNTLHWLDVWVDSTYNMLIASCLKRIADDIDEQHIMALTSANGIDWTEPQQISYENNPGGVAAGYSGLCPEEITIPRVGTGPWEIFYTFGTFWGSVIINSQQLLFGNSSGAAFKRAVL